MDYPEHVIILCGGRGTRLRQGATRIPKALVEIGGEPILVHVIRIFAAQGFRRFLLCTGYQADQVERFVSTTAWPDGVEVACFDTGLDTPTGGRLARAGARLGPERPCFVTYADGLADIDLAALADFHRGHGGAATVTVVRPQLQFGVVDVGEDERVHAFREKPRLEDWVNGGFLCLSPEAFGYLGADTVLEGEPMSRLADDGKLYAFRHRGFWRCLDTYKDALALNDLWAGGDAPWVVRG